MVVLLKIRDWLYLRSISLVDRSELASFKLLFITFSLFSLLPQGSMRALFPKDSSFLFTLYFDLYSFFVEFCEVVIILLFVHWLFYSVFNLKRWLPKSPDALLLLCDLVARYLLWEYFICFFSVGEELSLFEVIIMRLIQSVSILAIFWSFIKEIIYLPVFAKNDEKEKPSQSSGRRRGLLRKVFQAIRKKASFRNKKWFQRKPKESSKFNDEKAKDDSKDYSKTKREERHTFKKVKPEKGNDEKRAPVKLFTDEKIMTDQVEYSRENAILFFDLSASFRSIDLKKAYSLYIKRNHPDIVASQTKDAQVLELANRKLQVANRFYALLKKT